MRKRFAVLFLALILGCGGILSIPPKQALADTFDPTRVIDDAIFDNPDSMSIGQIDSFLNSFPSSCISPNHGFTAPDPVGYSPSTGYRYGGNVTGGTVIWDAAHAYDINPKVLLTILQKEQSLVSGGGGCSTLRYASALGFGCPDSGITYSYSGVNIYTINGVTTTSVSGTCVNSSAEVGFSQQLIRAAWLLKFGEQRSEGNVNWAIIRGNWNNSDDPQDCYSGPMTPGFRVVCPHGSNIFYDGFTTIDGSSTLMSNGATAALYWYTPHFNGNQSFFNLYTSWFGLPFWNDTNSPHPNGSVISDGQNIYLIQNNARSLIANPAVFASYGYTWDKVLTATSGDDALPLGTPVNTLAPGTLFTTNTGQVYVMNYVSGTLQKQWLSFTSFQNLGYQWSQVMNIPPGYDTTPLASGIYTSTQHPAGTLILDGNNTYVIGQGSRSLILGTAAFNSYNWSWNNVHNATSDDDAISVGQSTDINQGTIVLANGNIYDIDYDGSGVLKRPVGPWTCYQSQFHYTSNSWISINPAVLPSRTGSNVTC